MRTAWIELWTGLGGDMLVGALLDAGWGEERLRACVAALGLDARVTVERREHRGLTGLGIRVDAPESHHRAYTDIVRMIEAAGFPDPVRVSAVEAFRRLGEAESRIHGMALDRVHFHEVGAADSIVDIVASALAVHELGIEALFCGPVPIGGGTVEAAHGTLPVPAPATALLLEGWPVRPVADEGEFFTPTAAALLRALARPSAHMPAMRLERVGYGAGTRRHPSAPNLVRVWIGEAVEPPGSAEAWAWPGSGTVGGAVTGTAFEAGIGIETVTVLETAIDDMDPRLLSGVCEDLLAAGALDVLRTPVFMKKGRVGTLVTVLTRPQAGPDLARRILEATTTLGVRQREERRWVAPRRSETVETSFGPVSLKRVGGPGGVRRTVEYEDIARIARESRIPAQWVHRRILDELQDAGGPPVF